MYQIPADSKTVWRDGRQGVCVHLCKAQMWVRVAAATAAPHSPVDLKVLQVAGPARLVGRAHEEALCLFLADILQLRDEDFFDGCG